MGEIILNKVKGMNWMAKISLVLIFTLAFSTFMYQGWYKPKQVQAAVVTYYVETAAATNVGFDGTTTMTALADINVSSPPVANTNRALTNTTVPTGTTRYRIQEGAAVTGTGREYFRSYTPAYAVATTIAANATAYADFYIRTTGTSVVAWATMYEYNDTTGFVGAAKGTATFTGNATITTRQAMNNVSFGNAAFTVAAGNRLVVVYGFDLNAVRVAYLWGQASSTSPSGYQSFTVTESLAATPPMESAGTLATSPQYVNGPTTYIDNPVTITENFTSGTAVNACQYTLNNGTTWTAGVVSGAGPYTCTATSINPGANGTATTIGMRASNDGGATWSTLTATLARTVDSVGPVDGATLTATAASSTQINLSWSAAVSDAGSGIAATNTYKVVRAAGAVAPVDCTGVAIYTGTALLFNDTGLTPSTQYSYRVCAYDNLANPSTGLTATASTLAGGNTTTLGTGVNATNVTVCPGATQKLGGFSFASSTGTDSVTALTVTTTGQAGITSLQIWNEAGTTQYFATVNNGGTDIWNFSGGTPIPVTTATANLKIVAIYDPYATAPAGNTLTTGYVSAYTCTNAKAGADTAEATVTLNHTASTAAVWGANSGGATITLNWTNGSGGNALIVRFPANTDTTQPTDGTTYTVGSAYGTGGTVVYEGTGATTTDSPLAGTYYYRIYAHDSCSNYPSPFNTTTCPWSVALTSTSSKLPSTITSCGGCHGYGTTFNDGTSRNVPAGTFPGSHNKHVVQAQYVCSVCHVVPATQTSADYGHRNSTILMASPINGETGAAYVKGTSWAQTNNPTAFTACVNTYCHSQGTSKTTNTGETRTTILSAPLTTLVWGTTAVCTSCHGYPPSYANGDTTWGAAKANSHSKHKTQCSTCHNATTSNSTTITGPAQHVDKNYDIVQGNGATIGWYTYAGNGGTCGNISCHSIGAVVDASRQWGAALPTTYQCVTCHQMSHAITVGPLAGTGTRDPVVNEFGLAWGHKKSGRGAVADADCIVCHLEGMYSAGVGSAVVRTTYHGDGYIDLRDPKGAGETEITDMGGVTPFRFAKFSTSYAAGSRTSTGNTSNNIDNVLTQKFCLACHDSTGATNPTARSNNGGTGTQYMPFGGVNLGANYTVANGAAAAGGLVNVKDEFATTNTSYHPVRGPLNKDFPYSTRLASPYNNIGTARNANNNTTHVLANSVVINCFDCHNTSTPLTARTVAAHGNAVTLRGTIYGSAPTLCLACHIGGTLNYWGPAGADMINANGHATGSAYTDGTNGGNQIAPADAYTCSNCHGSSTAYPTRPLAAQDTHGQTKLVGGGVWTGGSANNGNVYSFIRNTTNFTGHRPYRSSQYTTGDAECVAGGCGTMGPYYPGGTY